MLQLLPEEKERVFLSSVHNFCSVFHWQKKLLEYFVLVPLFSHPDLSLTHGKKNKVLSSGKQSAEISCSWLVTDTIQTGKWGKYRFRDFLDTSLNHWCLTIWAIYSLIHLLTNSQIPYVSTWGAEPFYLDKPPPFDFSYRGTRPGASAKQGEQKATKARRQPGEPHSHCLALSHSTSTQEAFLANTCWMLCDRPTQNLLLGIDVKKNWGRELLLFFLPVYLRPHLAKQKSNKEGYGDFIVVLFSKAFNF